VVKLALLLTSKVDWLMSISLVAMTSTSSVNFICFVSVPKSPFTINNPKFALKSLAQSPLGRAVTNDKGVVKGSKSKVTEREDRL
jgi:hypothetical protein